ncbi:MAG: PASTA domain-containing protein [Bacteroidia bacterium]|nr:PASTA domain-containing protein [Bacteroidia bacterium]
MSQEPRATLWEYLRSKEFFYTIGSLILGFILLTLLLFNVFLPWVTRHNVWVEVPNVAPGENRKFTKLQDAIRILEKHGLTPVVQDSLYSPGFPPEVVVSQQPLAFTDVKPGRRIYLVVSKRSPPSVKLPDIENTNREQARYQLENWGLKIGNISYVPGGAPDEVVEVRYKGRKISPGDELPRGAQVDLVMSQGPGTYNVHLPSVVGKPLDEAVSILSQAGLIYGGARTKNDPKIKEPGVVVDQNPRPRSASDSVKANTTVILFISGEIGDVPEGVEEQSREE